MKRKEVGAILADDFVEFLKQTGLYEKFTNSDLTCKICGEIMTLNNIFAIYGSSEIYFCCNKEPCIRSIEGGIK